MHKFLELMGVLKDIKFRMNKLFNTVKTQKECFENYQKYFDIVFIDKFNGISKILEKDNWIFDNKLSILDFIYVEIIEMIFIFEKENNLNLVSKFKNFEKYINNFLNLEKINLYRKSNKFIERPFFNESAIWK